ncbi:LOW QUALITY PROTEIN: lipid droplet-regulating VLDL assembly factor AUP1 [Gastrophryne carolinensis]
MEQPGLEAMLDLHRFPADPLTCVLLLLYAPIGLCLVILRLFIGAHVFLVSCVLPDSAVSRYLLRVMSAVLGVVVTETEGRSPSARIYASNHVTHFDHNVVGLLAPASTPSVSRPPGFLCWAQGFLELGAPGSRSQLLESLKHYLSQPGGAPLLLFPEEEATNGRAGLLQFSSWPFSLLDSVQPLSLRVTRPLLSPAVSGSPWFVELLWLLFVPYTAYHVRWLPTVSRTPRESDEDFGSRVQKVLASSLGVVGTTHKAADLAEYLKRRAMEPPPRPPQHSPSPSSVSPAARGMAQRVKEVLPQVPLAVIYQDLAQTGCVDTTITNILEGNVPYVPEAESQAGYEAPGRAARSHNKPIPKGFARRPEDRHLSLQERKEALYEYARRRYLDKFGHPGTLTEGAEKPEGDPALNGPSPAPNLEPEGDPALNGPSPAPNLEPEGDPALNGPSPAPNLEPEGDPALNGPSPAPNLEPEGDPALNGPSPAPNLEPEGDPALNGPSPAPNLEPEGDHSLNGPSPAPNLEPEGDPALNGPSPAPNLEPEGDPALNGPSPAPNLEPEGDPALNGPSPAPNLEPEGDPALNGPSPAPNLEPEGDPALNGPSPAPNLEPEGDPALNGPSPAPNLEPEGDPALNGPSPAPNLEPGGDHSLNGPSPAPNLEPEGDPALNGPSPAPNLEPEGDPALNGPSPAPNLEPEGDPALNGPSPAPNLEPEGDQAPPQSRARG